MYRYSVEEQVFIVKNYWITGSIKNCQRRSVEQFGGRNQPSKHCIQNLVKILETKGTLLDVRGGGRPQMLEKTVNDIANRLLASPRKSLQRLCKKLDYQEACVKELLKRSACMLTGLQLSRNLYSKITIQTFIDENPGIFDYTLFSDEAWFHLSGYVNSQNTRLWGSENPHAMFEEPLHSQKVGLFCVLSQRRINGPIFFDTTVTSQMYIFQGYLQVGCTA
jgi:hypothetical protein